MLPADGGGGGVARGSSDIERGVNALKDFRSKVNALLGELENGAAGKSKVALANVSRASFGGLKGDFDEAEDFFKQYQRVHTLLVSFSQSLGDQIELLSIGVKGADLGYDTIEEDARQRFHVIQARLDQARDAYDERQSERDVKQKEDGSRGSEPARGNDTSVPTDLR
ncbi:hypothetical protein ABZ208_25510 [Streptomyces sp. NPDC006208]|uniref:hypothetical protein n=1 Tax=Streptomyces sp. NPDC006208 TaxID=3156734 RepID=UPI0033B8094F